MKNVCAMYFSGTGTTEKIVTTIAKKIGTKLEISYNKFDFTIKNVRNIKKEFTKEDIVVFGVPVIAGRVPNLLLKYLETVKGNEALAVPIVLFGNRNFDDALIELRNILTDNGFIPVAAGAFVGEHSFSNILGMNRPDGKDLAIANDFAIQIAGKIKSKNNLNKVVDVKGKTPIRPYYQPRDSKGNPIDIRKVKPKTNNLCINCKLCAVLCPLQAINYDNVREVPGVCMKCCVCVKKCPTGAKYYDDANYLYHQHELEDQYARRAEPEVFL